MCWLGTLYRVGYIRSMFGGDQTKNLEGIIYTNLVYTPQGVWKKSGFFPAKLRVSPVSTPGGTRGRCWLGVRYRIGYIRSIFGADQTKNLEGILFLLGEADKTHLIDLGYRE